MEKIVIASDHGGFQLKELIKQQLVDRYEVIDLGVDSEKSVNYPDYAHKLAKKIEDGTAQKGILICGSGIGVSIAANRHKGIRAALVDSVTLARLCREHNDANVLCMGGRIVGTAIAEEIVETFLTTSFLGGRHLERIKMIEAF